MSTLLFKNAKHIAFSDDFAHIGLNNFCRQVYMSVSGIASVFLTRCLYIYSLDPETICIIKMDCDRMDGSTEFPPEYAGRNKTMANPLKCAVREMRGVAVEACWQWCMSHIRTDCIRKVVWEMVKLNLN